MSPPRAGREKAWIRTASGGKFWPLAPRARDVKLADVAHALSNLCRFTGHVRDFYSVATHCVGASQWVEEEARRRGLSSRAARKLALEALLHDASEAYLADLSTPIKRTEALAGYREAEERVRLVIAEKFGLPRQESPIVKEADRAMLLAEARDLLPKGTRGFERVPGAPASWQVAGELPWHAEKRFVERFEDLGGRP